MPWVPITCSTWLQKRSLLAWKGVSAPLNCTKLSPIQDCTGEHALAEDFLKPSKYLYV